MSESPKVDVKALAALSRIAIKEVDIPRLEAELGEILSFVEEVQKVDVSVLPIATDDLHNVTRSDTDPYDSGIFTEAILSAAPKRNGEYIEVKQVLAHTKKSKEKKE